MIFSGIVSIIKLVECMLSRRKMIILISRMFWVRLLMKLLICFCILVV